MKIMDVKAEIKCRSDGEFLMSVNNRLNQMIGAVPYDMTEFKKELELKEGKRDTKTKKEIENYSQNYLRGDDFTGIPEHLLKLYLPDDAAIARELWRIKEYAEKLDTIKEEKEEDLYEGSTEEDIKPEFSNGAEYLDWLDRQLPFLEPFLPEYEVHQYFFREWSRHDFSYFSSLETLFEEELDENITEEDDEEDIEPEFVSGEEYLGWLGRQLPCLEPFVGDGTIHACYEFEWCKRNDYAPRLNTLIEDNENEEQRECRVKDSRELDVEEINPYIKLMFQPTMFNMEFLMTQSPLSLVEICSQRIGPTTSQPDYGTNFRDIGQQTEQTCKKARNRIFSFKFLHRNKKEREDKKKAPGFFYRLFH